MILANSPSLNLLIGIFIAIGVIIAIVVFIRVLVTINTKINNLVRNNSDYIQSINVLNNKYLFFTVRTARETIPFYLDTKRKFDTFNFNKKATEQIKYNNHKYRNIVNAVENNRVLLEKYKDDLKKLKVTSNSEIAKRCKISLKNFVKREKKIASTIIKQPVVNYSLTIKWEYTSPAGQNHYSNSYTFNYDTIKKMVTIDDFYQPNSNNDSSFRSIPKQKSAERGFTLDDIPNLED